MNEWTAQSEIIEKEWMNEWPLSVNSRRAPGWSYAIVADKSFTIVSEYFVSPAYCIVWAGYIQGKSSYYGLDSWIFCKVYVVYKYLNFPCFLISIPLPLFPCPVSLPFWVTPECGVPNPLPRKSQGKASPPYTHRGEQHSLVGDGWGDPIRTTEQKAWDSVYSVSTSIK
jgi:hypothetical protein